jgi:uncharacterized protein
MLPGMSPGTTVPAIPDRALAALPVFPLPDVVFFPHALLPLHIFEPRYKAMMSHVLEGHGLMAVARVQPGHLGELGGRPPVFEIAGVGACVSVDRLPDGRYNLMLRGLSRVRLADELPPEQPFRLFRAVVLADAQARATGSLAAAHAQLVALCDRLAEAVPDDGGALRQLARVIGTPGGCADAVASGLVRDPDARQALLEELDAGERLERVSAHVAELLQSFAPMARNRPVN